MIVNITAIVDLYKTLLNPMTFKCYDITVSKLDMARIQLDAAIYAYFNGCHIAAITLAGAAEEIFGAMLKRDGKENSVEKIASIEPMSKISNEKSKRIAYLNQVRNNLKHASNKLEDNFVMTNLDSYILIVRALANASLLEVNDSILMNKFREYHKPKHLSEV